MNKSKVYKDGWIRKWIKVKCKDGYGWIKVKCKDTYEDVDE